jgi:O-antigen ligase
MRSGEALVWRSLALRVALVAVPGWFTVAVLIFAVPLSTKLIVGTVLFTSLISPAAGLLTVAAVAPLGHLLNQLVGVEGFRMSEALVLAFLAGWLLRAQDDRRGPTVPSLIGWLLVCAIAASIGGLAWQLGQHRGELARTFDLLFHAYYLIGDQIGFVEGARLLEGLALMVATVTLFRQRPRLAVALPAVLAAAATAAAAASVLLWRGIAPAAILERYARIGYRVSAHVADVNAAGSYFAMTLCLALGMAVRARGRERALWLIAGCATGVGLWFSESRTAIGAAGVVIAAAVAWTASLKWRPAVRLVTLAPLVAVALGLGSVRAHFLERDQTYRGAGFRTQFNETSVRMIAARPLFGVGVGQYYRTSPLFLSPQLAWTYGAENAHNYFLQVGAELGVLGLALFSAWAGVVLWHALKALGHQPRDARLLGGTAGVIVLLGTCLTGHPLLVDEVAFPFWIQFGLVAGLAGSVLLNADLAADGFRPARRTPKAWLLATVAIAVCIVVSAPVSAARGAVEPPASQSVDGFYGWETGSDGMRFRWTGHYASLFVPADVTHVYVPVRVPTRALGVAPMGVEVMIGGSGQGRTLVGEPWATISLALPDAEPPARFKRIDFKVDRTWQPALYIAGNADLRAVGVQVGECQLVR